MFIVTGATGHIGNAIVRLLVKEGEDVRLLIRKKDHSLDDVYVDYAIGNLFDRDFLSKYISKGDIVIHCAGHIDLANKNQLNTYRVNYLMTKKIADLCYEKEVRLIYMSSVDAIYKDNPMVKEPLIIDPKKVRHTYSKSKALATKYVKKRIAMGLDGMVLYPSAVIGTHDFKPSKVGQTLLSLKSKRICFALKGGYNFIDVRDVALTTYLAAKSTLCEDVLLTNEYVSIRQLYQQLSTVLNKKKLIITLPTFLTRLVLFAFPFFSQMMIDVVTEKVTYHHDKMKRLFPIDLISFETSLKETIEWFNENNQL